MEKTIGYRRQETTFEKLIGSKLFWVCFLIFGLSYPVIKSMNRTLPADLPRIHQLPEFEMMNEFGKPFGTKNLNGRVYIASFIFTNCPSTCIGLMEKMQKIQKRVRGLGTKVGLVTFSVDPITDTPPVLFKYSRKLASNPHVWSFVTTGSQTEMRDLLIDGFKVPMGELEEVNGIVDGDEVTVWDIAHTEKFVLVDHEGFVRGYYSSTKDDINKLMIDVGLMVNKVNQF